MSFEECSEDLDSHNTGDIEPTECLIIDFSNEKKTVVAKARNIPGLQFPANWRQRYERWGFLGSSKEFLEIRCGPVQKRVALHTN